MVGKALCRSIREFMKKELWQKLPKKMMYQTYCVIIDYLLYSRKISCWQGRQDWMDSIIPEALTKGLRTKGFSGGSPTCQVSSQASSDAFLKLSVREPCVLEFQAIPHMQPSRCIPFEAHGKKLLNFLATKSCVIAALSLSTQPLIPLKPCGALPSSALYLSLNVPTSHQKQSQLNDKILKHDMRIAKRLPGLNDAEKGMSCGEAYLASRKLSSG